MAKYENKDGVGIIPEGTTIIKGECYECAFDNYESMTSVIIPESVTEIGRDAFNGCINLKSVVIPNSVTKIDFCAFMDCKSLINIVIPDSVEIIQSGAFDRCKNLTSLFIPNSVKDLDGAFRKCMGLTNIVVAEGNPVYDSRDNCNAIIKTKTNELILGGSSSFIPDSVTSIVDSAFCDCADLTDIVIPDSVTEIGNYAFGNCVGLTNIVIPDSVASVGSGIFNGCRELTNITVSTGNKTFDSRNNCNAIIESETNTLIQGCANTVIPDSVTKIGAFAFEFCVGLSSIIIPNSVTEIGWYAFKDSGLTSISIPKSVTEIDSECFDCCSSLKTIYVPTGRADYYKKCLPEKWHSFIVEQP